VDTTSELSQWRQATEYDGETSMVDYFEWISKISGEES